MLLGQVYGRNRGSTSAKGRWLARGVETLLFQYPGLRVAFMDDAPAPAGGAPQYSVLIRGTGAPPQGTDSAVDELYRCARLLSQGTRLHTAWLSFAGFVLEFSLMCMALPCSLHRCHAATPRAALSAGTNCTHPAFVPASGWELKCQYCRQCL